MSTVNQAEKDGILYDINDARVYTVDLGTLTLTPDDPNDPKSFSGNTTLTAEQFLNLQNSEIGFIKFTFNGTNIITTVNENIEYPGVTGIVTASTSMMMSGSFSTISVLAQYEGTMGETIPTQVIIVLDILSDVGGGVKVVDLGYQESFGGDDPIVIDEETFNTIINNDCMIKVETREGYLNFAPCQAVNHEGFVLKQFYALDSEGQLWIGGVEAADSQYLAFFQSMGRLSSVSGNNDGTNWTSITINGTTKNIPAEFDHYATLPFENPGQTQLTQEEYDKLLFDDSIIVYNTNTGKEIYQKAIYYNGGPSQAAPYLRFDKIDSKAGIKHILVYTDRTYTKSNETIEYSVISSKFNGTSAAYDTIFSANGSGGVRWIEQPIRSVDIDNISFPVAGVKYYRHNGSSSANYEIGKIYCCEGNEARLIDGSSSGESIYELSGTVSSGDTISDAAAITVLNAHKPIIINGLQLYYNGIFNNQIQYTTRIMNTNYNIGNGRDFCDTKVYLFNPTTNKMVIVEPHVWRHCFDIDFDNNSGIAGHFNLEIISNSADFTDTGWDTGRILATLLYRSDLNSYDHLATGIACYFSGDAKTVLGVYSWDSNEVSIRYYDPSIQDISTFSLYKHNGSSPYNYITNSSYYANKIY